MKALIHAPLFKFAFCFLCGMICADIFQQPFGYLCFPAFLILLAVLVQGKRKKRFSLRREGTAAILIYVLAFGIGAARHRLADPEQWESHLLELNCEEVQLAGHLISPVKTNQWGRKVWMEVGAIYQDSSWHKQSGRLQLYVKPEHTERLAEHDSIIILAKIVDIKSQHESYLTYLHRNGIYYAAYVEKFSIGGPKKSIKYLSQLYQQLISTKLGALFSDPLLAGIAQAMFLGDKSGLTPEVREMFSVAGLSHILAISGLHVGIIFLMLNWLFQPFHLLKRGLRFKHATVLFLLVVYMLLTGAGPAVVRAVLMFSAILLFRISYQRYHLLNLIAIAAVGQLFYDPLMLWQPGFQLSYSAVVAIVIGLPYFERWVYVENTWVNKCFGSIGVSLVATLATAPFVWMYFGQFSTYFLLANLLASVISFAVVFSGFLTVLFCWVPGINECLAYCSEILLDSLLTIARWVSELPHAVIRAEDWSYTAVWIVFLQIALAFMVMLVPKIITFLQNRFTSVQIFEQSLA